jgi:hypothetical protein
MTVFVIVGLALIAAGSRHIALENETIVRRTSGALR